MPAEGAVPLRERSAQHDAGVAPSTQPKRQVVGEQALAGAGRPRHDEGAGQPALVDGARDGTLDLLLLVRQKVLARQEALGVGGRRHEVGPGMEEALHLALEGRADT